MVQKGHEADACWLFQASYHLCDDYKEGMRPQHSSRCVGHLIVWGSRGQRLGHGPAARNIGTYNHRAGEFRALSG